MDADTFRSLIDYHYWARDRLLDALGEVGDGDLKAEVVEHLPSAHALLLHLMGFEAFWSVGISDREARPGWPSAEDFPTLAAIREEWASVDVRMRHVLAELDAEELQRGVPETAPNGKTYAPRVEQILSQFVAHQGQHRAELALVATQLGASPGNLDWWGFDAISPVE